MFDCGEMGLSHGGMRPKAYNAYEQTLHIPLVVSNPRLFPVPVHIEAPASLVDIVPTVAAISGNLFPDRLHLRGTDLTSIIRSTVENPRTASVRAQESVLFAMNENLGSLKK